jgi:hypothetical protein
MDPLHAYTLKILALGQRTLALYRQGEVLPETLIAPAAELETLEDALRHELAAPPARPGSDDSASLASRPTIDDILVLDVEEEAEGGAAFVYAPPDALSPLVVDKPLPDSAVAESASIDTELLDTPGILIIGDKGLTGEPRACVRCGTSLRPGKRFCHRCGAPI